MQGTYIHIPETNYVPREHGVAAILLIIIIIIIIITFSLKVVPSLPKHVAVLTVLNKIVVFD